MVRTFPSHCVWTTASGNHPKTTWSWKAPACEWPLHLVCCNLLPPVDRRWTTVSGENVLDCQRAAEGFCSGETLHVWHKTVSVVWGRSFYTSKSIAFLLIQFKKVKSAFIRMSNTVHRNLYNHLYWIWLVSLTCQYFKNLLSKTIL